MQAWACVAIAAIGVLTCAQFALGDLLRGGSYDVPAARSGAAAALKLIPPRASVAATNHLVPHLSQRDTVVLFGPRLPDVRYIVAQTGDPDPAALFPYTTLAEQRAALARLRGTYRRVHAGGGVEVWERPDGDAVAAARRARR